MIASLAAASAPSTSSLGIGLGVAGALRLGERVGERDRAPTACGSGCSCRCRSECRAPRRADRRRALPAARAAPECRRRPRPRTAPRARATRARSSSSVPWCAISCLFAVTTDLPASSAPRTQSYAGCSPPTSSMTMSTSDVEDLVGRLGPAHRRRHPVHALARDVAIEDVRQLDVRHFAAAQNARDRLPDRAESEQGHARAVSRGIPWRCHSSAPVFFLSEGLGSSARSRAPLRARSCSSTLARSRGPVAGQYIRRRNRSRLPPASDRRFRQAALAAGRRGRQRLPAGPAHRRATS